MKLIDYLKHNEIAIPDFAEKIGVTPTSLNRYVNKERIPEKSVMKKIKKYTGGIVTADSFYQ